MTEKKDISEEKEGEVTISVVIGDKVMSLSDLENLKKGDSIHLEQVLREPVIIRNNGNIVGKGILTNNLNKFSIQLTENINTNGKK